MTKSDRYIQLHTELWEAFCDGYSDYGISKLGVLVGAKHFLTWLRNHSGVYQPMCREYLDILGGMKA